MTISRAIRTILTVAFAAWMSLCCCEKRILAHAFDAPTDASSPACCAKGCCADELPLQDGDSDDANQPRNCADGCCTKGAIAVPSFTLDLDLVGSPLPPAADCRAWEIECAGHPLAHEDRAVGEPPPRLALIISRRLRI
ncbi:MAG: hypothetical protein RIS45_1847 [Planctomycetota bacterium]|jgi:hypothetical protein